tara:strand:- start:3549 stop:3755 length:207 start_codon:yes stop_codon:yes gene_type:complete
MKKSNTYSKHDLRRAIEDLYRNTQMIIQRLTTVETLFNEYITMEDTDGKFKEFLDKKYKVEKPETLKK